MKHRVFVIWPQAKKNPLLTEAEASYPAFDILERGNVIAETNISYICLFCPDRYSDNVNLLYQKSYTEQNLILKK